MQKKLEKLIEETEQNANYLHKDIFNILKIIVEQINELKLKI